MLTLLPAELLDAAFTFLDHRDLFALERLNKSTNRLLVVSTASSSPGRISPWKTLFVRVWRVQQQLPLGCNLRIDSALVFKSLLLRYAQLPRELDSTVMQLAESNPHRIKPLSDLGEPLLRFRFAGQRSRNQVVRSSCSFPAAADVPFAVVGASTTSDDKSSTEEDNATSAADARLTTVGAFAFNLLTLSPSLKAISR